MGEEKEVKKQEEEEDGGERTTMKPWEQHGGVITIPRFDYNAPSSLLHHSHSGFLITCPIKREKSATKEAISILEKYVGFSSSCSSENFDSCDANIVAKRRKLCLGAVDGGCPSNIESSVADRTEGKVVENSCLSSPTAGKIVEKCPILSLVKLTGSGLLLFTLPGNDSPNVVNVLSNVIQSLESGTLRTPLWCHRIFPIQATCCLIEEELSAVVTKLVLQFVNDRRNELQQPIKFAVGFNRRGVEEAEIKNSRSTSKEHERMALLDRNKCFSVVAAAVKNAVSDSVVDLKSPELAVLVELLPLSGLPNGSSLVAAISVLPHDLVTTKPRLCIKALVSDTKAAAKGGKNQ
ncbi:uncharacterized protein LOC127798192 isoform X2 [Diospyros lotus]|uniref:uncharacterized protein LOC127798192 isoform X2 n=1 Tax=Diospyros lotus TaxID=55363 RepID=UPI00225B4F51|nr:uncharacterized protein LOC127798192 isoform X2 [Diospyros lotus]